MQQSRQQSIRHSHIVCLDTAMRLAWYGQGQFGVSCALKASARMKPRKQQGNDDSIDTGKGTGDVLYSSI
jgi:hypothetical protein